MLLADGFDAPVGTPEERRSSKIWPGDWIDVTGFATHYQLKPGLYQYHTGADLNLNVPHWDADRGAPVYAPANGEVIYVGQGGGTWGKLLIIRHDPLVDGTQVWTRFAHLDEWKVQRWQRVVRGQEIATIGNAGGVVPYHLHYDIAITNILERYPEHWPGINKEAVLKNYTDPRLFTTEHRPEVQQGEVDMVDEAKVRQEINAAQERLNAALEALNGTESPQILVVGGAPNGLFVRSGPGVGYGIVGVLHNGDQVQVLQYQGEWIRHNRGGWSHSSYLWKL